MMIKRIIYIGILLFTSNITFAQNVGINTTSPPKKTLDVNGTMRIDDIGEPVGNSVPLGWIPSNDNEEDEKEGQVVVYSGKGFEPLGYVTYRLNINNAASDYVRDANLKIDASKYTALLSQAFLVRDGFSFSNPSRYAAYINVISQTDDDTSVLGKIGTIDGKFVKIGTNNQGTEVKSTAIDSESNNFKYLLGVVQPTTYLFVGEDGMYHFYGDYEFTGPLKDYGPYSWILNIITIKK